MKDKLIKILSVLSLLVMFANWKHYNPMLLKDSLENTIFLEDTGVRIEVKELTSEESEKIFSSDLPSKGYLPMQVTIYNDSEKSFSLCRSSIDMKTAEPEEIINKLAKGALPRKIAYSIIGLFFWPMAIPSMIDSATTHKVLKKKEQGMLAKSVKKEVVPPYSTLSRIVFVPKEAKTEQFKLTIIDLDSLKSYSYTQQLEVEAIG